MKNSTGKILLSLVAISVGFYAIFVLSNYVEQNRSSLPDGYEDTDLSLPGKNLKGYVFGAEGLIADWYWIRSLQYIGNKLSESKEKVSLDDLTPLNPRLLYPLLDNATSLDPNFIEVYSYGAVVLPAIDPKLAIEIAQKGIDNNPDNLRLYQHKGYIHWKLKQYKKAEEVYKAGAQISGAPKFFEIMAANMQSEAGNRETARQIYKEMFQSAQDSQTKKNARLKLLELEYFDERDIFEASLKEFRDKNNRCINNISELFPFLQKSKLPNGRDFRIDANRKLVDPSGAPYLLDKNRCEIIPDVRSTEIPMS